jgi:hypothetical protein
VRTSATYTAPDPLGRSVPKARWRVVMADIGGRVAELEDMVRKLTELAGCRARKSSA